MSFSTFQWTGISKILAFIGTKEAMAVYQKFFAHVLKHIKDIYDVYE